MKLGGFVRLAAMTGLAAGLAVALGSAAEAQKRLRIMERTSNGFELAEVDLETRGPGEYFGTRQAGLPDLRVAKLTDHELIQNARQWANRLLDDDPYMRAPEHQLLWSRAGKFDVAGAAAVH